MEMKKIKIEMLNIKKKYGKLTADVILAEARNKNNILHNEFCWDNTEAAKQWRLQQARCLLDRITEVVVVEGKQTTQRSFFNVKSTKTKERIYVTLEEAIKVKTYREELLNQVVEHLNKTIVLIKMFKKE